MRTMAAPITKHPITGALSENVEASVLDAEVDRRCSLRKDHDIVLIGMCLLELHNREHPPGHLGEMIFRSITALPEVEVVKGMMQDIAERQPLAPVVVSVLLGTLIVDRCQPAQADGRDEIETIPLRILRAHRP